MPGSVERARRRCRQTANAPTLQNRSRRSSWRTHSAASGPRPRQRSAIRLYVYERGAPLFLLAGTTVVDLLATTRPSAIPGLVIAIAVDAIESHAGRTLAHIGE